MTFEQRLEVVEGASYMVFGRRSLPRRINCKGPGRFEEEQGGQCGWNGMSQEEARRKRVQRGELGLDGRMSFTKEVGATEGI